jgi:ribosomal protein S17E
MGKIKGRLVKRTVRTLLEKGIEFEEGFEHNKKILGREMPSKKLRNQIAGYASRLKRQEKDDALKVPEKK